MSHISPDIFQVDLWDIVMLPASLYVLMSFGYDRI